MIEAIAHCCLLVTFLLLYQLLKIVLKTGQKTDVTGVSIVCMELCTGISNPYLRLYYPCFNQAGLLYTWVQLGCPKVVLDHVCMYNVYNFYTPAGE